MTVQELQEITVPFKHKISRTGIIHGYALYFDAIFRGSIKSNQVILSTAPSEPATHWYQTRLLLREPVGVNKGQNLSGELKMVANKEQSF